MGRGVIPGTRYSSMDFINRFANLAQSSQYRAHVTIPRAMQQYMQQKNIDSTVLRETGVMCKATSLPGSALATHDVNDFYGVTQKSAYMRQFDGTIDLTFYIDADYNILYMFEHWMEYIMNLVGDSPQMSNVHYRAQYPDAYRSSLYVQKFNKDKDASWRVVNPLFNQKGSIVYEFINAFPQNISSTQVSYDPSSLLEFTVTFAYERYVTNRTRSLGQGGAQGSVRSGARRTQALKSQAGDNPSNPFDDGDDALMRAARRQSPSKGSIGMNKLRIAEIRDQWENSQEGEPGASNFAENQEPLNSSTQRIRQQQNASISRTNASGGGGGERQ